jgi:hypothetical protein
MAYLKSGARVPAICGFLFFCWVSACPASDFQISLGLQRVRFEPYGGVEGYYDQPIEGTITVKKFPVQFDVTIKNVSDSAKPFYEYVDAGAISSLSFELSGIDSGTVIMREKPQYPGSFDDEVNQYLNPGEQQVIPVLIDPEDWDNVPTIQKGKVISYMMRAVYQNDYEKIYSDYYELVFDGK